MSKQITINGASTNVPYGAVAFKFADPTEGARWIYDIDEAHEIANEDSSLIVYTITACISDGMTRNAGGECTFSAPTLDDAIEMAEDWVRDGDYTSPDSDTCDVCLVIVQGGDVIDRRLVTVDCVRE